jgi:hypothetical protein
MHDLLLTIMAQSIPSQQPSSVEDIRVNIGQQQRNVRGGMGLVVLGISTVVSVQIVQDGLTLWLGLLLLVLLQNGIMLMMEWNMGVCPVNAMRGRKSMTGWFSIGKKFVKDNRRLKAARKAARKQLVWSTIIAVIGTGIVLLFQ